MPKKTKAPPAAGFEVVSVPLDQLHQDPANARKHGERNLESIKASLKQFKQVEPLIVARESGKVIGGNGRLDAMRALGWTEALVTYVDLDNTQQTALGIALNRTAELAEWDNETLDHLLVDLKSSDFDIGILEMGDIKFLDAPDTDEPPAPEADPIAQSPATKRCPNCSHEWV